MPEAEINSPAVELAFENMKSWFLRKQIKSNTAK